MSAKKPTGLPCGTTRSVPTDQVVVAPDGTEWTPQVTQICVAAPGHKGEHDWT